MKNPRKIELLSPAKNAEVGKEAILHGADAVYIGAPRFGARSAAANSVGDIAALCEMAHKYDARVYVALNTLLKEDELMEAEKLIAELYCAGADALIVQDMGITRLDIPPIALHASTQTDNRTLDKVRFLQEAGFSQVVLARELSLEEIRGIARGTDVPLEVFIHGALCVSYSGQCYLSHAMCSRSANRGECAQYCRLPYTLRDGDGKILAKDKHLLSLKDLNQSDRLEQLLDAGATSLKIEGRLKEISYVKNCTAYYRRMLDSIFSRRSEYVRASSGRISLDFEPDLAKSFNRGFTHYFLDGRTKEMIVSQDTPKSLGEYVGKVARTGNNFIQVQTKITLHNGDGIGYFNSNGEFSGFRINRVEGDRIYPASMPPIFSGDVLYRNFDQEFEKRLLRKTAERRIGLDMHLYPLYDGVALSLQDETGKCVTVRRDMVLEPAGKDQGEQQKRLLEKLGNNIFEPHNIYISGSKGCFIPASHLSELKRLAIERLMMARRLAHRPDLRKKENGRISYPEKILSYRGNVANSLAEKFYREHGVEKIEPAFECKRVEQVPLMFTRHCIRFMLGYCTRKPAGGELKEPLMMNYGNKELILKFDCTRCEMQIYEKK